MKVKRLLFMLLVLLILNMAGCSSNDNEMNNNHSSSNQTAVLEFKANGEDFVRQGFTSKDGWDISFDKVYLTLNDIKAYITDPPYEPDREEAIMSDDYLSLPGTFTVDLAQGGEEADPISVGQVAAPLGFYNALSWQMLQAPSGEAMGHSILMQGTACKDGKTLPFKIGIGKEYQYYAGEFIGDERKGIVAANSPGDLEMTFHFDHIFGDGELPADEGLNAAALGFDPFAELAEKDQVITEEALAEHLSAAEYQQYLAILPTLGHVGEGHAFAVEL